MKLIPLYGKMGEIKDYAKVDDQDYDDIMQHRWSISICNYSAVRCINIGRLSTRRKGKSQCKKISMHRHIMNPTDNMMVEHLNLDRIDNRRENLRICTYSEYCKKTYKKKRQGGFLGVVKVGRRWESYIKYKGKKISIGLFPTPLQAAFAYDEKIISLFGKSANINFSSNNL
jgi:hypothetical protein